MTNGSKKSEKERLQMDDEFPVDKSGLMDIDHFKGGVPAADGAVERSMDYHWHRDGKKKKSK